MGIFAVKISFIINPVEGGWSPLDKRVGGTEECVIEWSKRLAGIGHQVSVFHNGRHCNYEGVAFQPYEAYDPGDITINVNYSPYPITGKTIYVTSLDKNSNLNEFDAVCVISQFAKNNTGVIHDNVYIVPPGYDSTQIYPDKKIPKQCLYASSPDRGLTTLLQAWPYVYEAHPDATLKVTYGAEPYDFPGVEFLGELSDQEMNQLYRESDYWCHPNTGIELYCMTGIKAQASGAIPVVIPSMALAETVRHGFFANKNNYADVLINALSQPLDIRERLAKEDYPNWEDSTAMLLDVINDIVEIA